MSPMYSTVLTGISPQENMFPKEFHFLQATNIMPITHTKNHLIAGHIIMTRIMTGIVQPMNSFPTPSALGIH